MPVGLLAFRGRLPLVAGCRLPLVAVSPQPRIGHASSVTRARTDATILVVEDEPALGRTAKRVLERWGYRVLVVSRGEEALRLLETGQRVSLVISDLSLPGMDGLALHDRLRASGHRAPFVLASGTDPKELGRRRALPAGMRLLPKPWDLAALAQTVETALELPRGDPPPQGTA